MGFTIVIRSTKINLKYLVGLLNSQLTAFWLKHKGKMQGGQYQVDKAPLLEVPICNPKNPELIISIVEKILKRKESGIDTTQLESEIDLMVYNLYQLTYDEVLVIDKDFEKQMSRADYDKLDYGFEYMHAEALAKPEMQQKIKI